MSTYFPFGISPSTVTSISYSVTATTASVAYSPSISATTALFAASVITPAATGAAGADAVCSPALAPTGATGATGAAGVTGTNLTSCPPGTKECSITPLPTGYTKVCIEYGACDPAYFTCPPSI